MSEKEGRRRLTFQVVLECAAFFGVACIAISLIFALCFKTSSTYAVYEVFHTIGDAIAYILSMILAFFWVRRKKHIAWVICYVAFVVLIVVFYIVGKF